MVNIFNLLLRPEGRNFLCDLQVEKVPSAFNGRLAPAYGGASDHFLSTENGAEFRPAFGIKTL